MAGGSFEIGKVDPKCWLCGTYTVPKAQYQPLICLDCWPGYRERKFVFTRPTQEEMEEMVRETDRKIALAARPKPDP